jgi:hypothetical protein
MERLLMVSTRRVRCLTSHLTNRVSGTRRCIQLATVLPSPFGLEISVSGRISTTATSSRGSLTLLPHTPSSIAPCMRRRSSEGSSSRHSRADAQHSTHFVCFSAHPPRTCHTQGCHRSKEEDSATLLRCSRTQPLRLRQLC